MSDCAGRISDADERRLYGDLAWTWPIISPPEDYVEEAEAIIAWLRVHVRGDVNTLLHLGCGGGHIDSTLKQHVRVTGVDVSPEMLALAADLNADVRYIRGDMRDIRIGETFDAVVIADSIGYMTTEDDLLAAFRTAFEHLRDGGVFLTYAEDTTERFQQNAVTISTSRGGDIDIVLVENSYDPDPADTQFDYVLIHIIRRNGEMSIEVDRHVGGLFPLQTWIDGLTTAGFEIVEMSETSDVIHFLGRRG